MKIKRKDLQEIVEFMETISWTLTTDGKTYILPVEQNKRLCELIVKIGDKYGVYYDYL